MKTDTAANIVSYLRTRGECTPKELIEHFGISPQAMFRQLKQLSVRGEIFKVGEPPRVLYMISRTRKKKKEINDDPLEIFRTNVSRVVGFVSIPVLGLADCGPAQQIAEQKPEGFVRLSKRLLPSAKNIFAIRAVGNSMNRARVGGQKTIEDGDLVLINSAAGTPQNGDYVLSVIDGVANIKKFFADRRNQQVTLISESKSFYPPICIHPQECDYFVNGKVVEVIKKIST